MYRTRHWVTALSALLMVSIASADESGDLKTHQARALKLQLPKDWKTVPTKSQMRAAQFAISDGKSQADLVVFYFGGGPTGGIKANIDRWVGQFAAEDRKIEMTEGKFDGGMVILVDAVGTWNKPDGPPFAQKKVKTPGSRVLNAIVILQGDGNQDYYFLKFSGPKELVGKHVKTIKTAIGMKLDSEKPFDLANAAN